MQTGEASTGILRARLKKKSTMRKRKKRNFRLLWWRPMKLRAQRRLRKVADQETIKQKLQVRERESSDKRERKSIDER